MKCSRCLQKNRPRARFCDQCATSFGGPHDGLQSYRELKNEVKRLSGNLTESIAHQTATAEILRIISTSPTDVEPVFNAIVRSAQVLTAAATSAVFIMAGEEIAVAAALAVADGVSAHDIAAWRAQYPRVPTPDTVMGRAILERQAVQAEDLKTDPRYQAAPGRLLGVRTILGVPMLREGRAIGAIAVWRREVKRFSDDQTALLETFANQAVIAIENVRLFNELQERNRALTEANAQVSEALERQTATSDILRVISRSPTDTQPVFDTIAASAARLCVARDAQVLRVDGDVLRLVAAYGSPSMPAVRPISRGHGVGRAVIDRRPIHVRDMAQALREFPETSAPQHGVQSIIAVPLLRNDVAVGVIRVSRTQIEPFTQAQIALLQTFADQAVIAIENVRLFNELEAKNANLSEALEQQTAAGEILRVISGSPADILPVLDAVATSAARLCDALDATILLRDGDAVVPRTHSGPLGAPFGERQRITRDWVTGRAILEGRTIHVPDLLVSDEFPEGRELARRYGHRATLVVPLLREGVALGAILVRRRESSPFSDKQIALLQTFADQAAIAIENVRLFNELGARNREIEEKSIQLEIVSQHKSEFLANMSHELRTPLNAIIGFSEVLADRMFGALNEKQEEYLNDIHASGQHLLSLINDILDLSKIEAGRMELEPTNFHLPASVNNALTLVRERAERHGIALHASIDDRIECIRADERRIKQVMLNLLSNAIKFTPEGGRIEVRATQSDGVVEISVSDTGVGIAPEDQEAIFEEFRQVGTASKKVEGTGLGLALSRKFIELHGGRISVRSTVGVGSTFTFTIPMPCAG
jgi:two-component system, NtrC family, sensor kinase